MQTFIGRQEELDLIENSRLSFQKKGLASLVVIKGRRRIGKSRLAQEFAKGKKFLNFSGIPPVDGMSAQDQRTRFAGRLSQLFSLPTMTFADWSDAFSYLTSCLTQESTVLLLDEISWMGSKDPTFVPKLKDWWDLEAQHFPNLAVIFCGSVSTWIEENIINSTAFLGRISLTIDLQPLSLPECGKFLREIGFKGSAYEMYKVLSVTGGVPWYLEQIFPQEMADANIQRLCFSKNGHLTTEFDKIFNDLFHRRGLVYREILFLLAQGMKTQDELRKGVGYAASGTFSNVLTELAIAGFITRFPQWSLKTGSPSKYSLYALSDPYIRFYIKYIEKNRTKIDQGSFQKMSINQLPGYDTIMGYQIESLLLQNRALLIQGLGIDPSQIIGDNPYMQRKTTRQKGCQIDYLIQTRSHNLFACEFKFKRREIGSEIIDEMKEKISRLSLPRKVGVAPVLFYASDLSDQVHDTHYFYRAINILDFLDPV